MLDWVGNDQPMKMRETSRDWGKKLNVNTNRIAVVALMALGFAIGCI